MGRVIVIGGGIAGLSVAWALAKRRHDVLLLEMGPRLAGQSSSRSAGMFRHPTAQTINVRLATRSLEIGQSLVPGFVNTVGGLYLCTSEEEQRTLLQASSHVGVVAARSMPDWLANQERSAVWSPRDGLIDVDRLVAALSSEARRLGAVLSCGVRVEALDTAAGQISGVIVGGERVAADVVIDAAGGWSEILSGAPSLHGTIRPRRRHLFILDAAVPVQSIVWDLAQGLYLRPHPEGLLACACDETDVAASDEVAIDPNVADVLRDKLSRWAPGLAKTTIRRQWAGIRPLTPDHAFIVGPDPRLQGLFRLTGFGGHGMTAGLAAGEIAAQLLSGETPEESRELSPSRPALRGDADSRS